MEHEITISNRQESLDISAASLRRLVEFVATAEGRGIDSVDVAIVDTDEIASLNSRYLDRDEVTDVLSFDISEANSPGISAQIVVCGAVAAEVGPRHGMSGDDELMLYIIHGLLHLMGYDDAGVQQAERMKRRQEQILAEFNPAR